MKKIGIYAGIVLLFLVLAYGFVPEVLTGKVVNQSDITGYRSMSQEAVAWNKAHPDDPTHWTDSMFGGMPTTSFMPSSDGDWTQSLYNLLLKGKRPANWLFISLLGAFLLMLSLGVDKVLAIKDVYPKLLACMKTVVGEDYPVIGTSGKIGISWGHSGGEASGLFTENYLAADGIENVIRVLEDMEDQKFTNLRFVELNACNGGCVGGVLTVENPYVAEVKLKRLRKYMPVARSHMHESEENVIRWTTGVQYEPVFRLGNNMMESFSRLNQVERLMKKFPGLDCGSCGAPTCKALAEDIVRGDANETDCVYYLRENLHKLSEEVAVLADDLHNGDRGGQETLRILKGYIQRISDEMSVLDKKDEDEE